MSRIMRSDLLCLLGNKRLKVTDKQCGQSVCQRLLKRCVFTVCICAFPHIPQKECDFFLWPRACKRLFVSVWQKQFASWILWTAETMFLLIREWQKKKEREKDRQSNRWDRDKSTVTIWLQSTPFTVKRAKSFWESWLETLRSVSLLSGLQMAFLSRWYCVQIYNIFALIFLYFPKTYSNFCRFYLFVF